MKFIVRTLIGLAIIIVIVLLLIYFKVLWVLAPQYTVQNPVRLEVPVMDMKAYEDIWDTHRRPYVYSLKSKNGGVVYIVGIEHTKDKNHPDLDTLSSVWNKSNPDVALVEGRVGNLFTWFQDPVEELGEGGLTSYLAYKNGVELYSWEPKKEDEVSSLIKKYPVEELAMFYSFRPYFSNIRYGVPADPEGKLQEYLESRTDTDLLRGVFPSWKELDEKWKRDFPDYDWRNYSSGNGYPEGYMHDIWNSSNNARDQHMIQMIIEFVSQGKSVFVTMGSSHAPRIEQTLITALK